MEEKTRPAEPVNPAQLPCPICGSTDYSWGIALSSNARVRFIADGAHGTGNNLKARKCNRCHNVQTFTEE